MQEETRHTYRAFLVRFWQEGEDVWRGMVEDPHSGQRHAFADVEQLLDFLRQQVRPAESARGEKW